MHNVEAEVVRMLLRQELISRSEITHITGWSKAKTSQAIRALVNRRILVEAGEGTSQGGRRPRLLGLNGQRGYIAGVDIGATSLAVALADLRGVILHEHSETADVRQPPEIFLRRACELITGLIEGVGCQPEQVLAIGVGVPGPVDFERGELVAPPLMPEWENYSIRADFHAAFPAAAVIVDNDVNIMALGEQYAGDGAQVEHFIFVKIGTGIGAGIVSNGYVHRGSNGCAGDIGHICVDKNGPLCRCGNTGCLEAMAAGPAIAEKAVVAARSGSSPILARLMEANAGSLKPEDVNTACRVGDPAALEIIRASGQMVGDVLAGLVNFFNPSHIFIGGGISNFDHHLLVAIRQAVLQRSLPLATANLSINFSRLGANSGITGAVALARENLFLVQENPFLSV